MKIRSHILTALLHKDLKLTLMNKNTLVMMVLPIIFAVLYGYVIPMGTSEESVNFIIILCQIMNLALVPVSLLSMMVAEEKEKNTLRTLMLSDVSAEEFLLSKSLVALLFMTVIALIDFVILKGVWMNLPIYLLASVLSSISLLFLGASVGLLCKDQMATGTLSAPIMILIMLPAIFSIYNPWMHTFARFLPTTGFVDLYKVQAYHQSLLSFDALAAAAVMLVWIVLAALIFNFIYRKKGIDQ